MVKDAFGLEARNLMFASGEVSGHHHPGEIDSIEVRRTRRSGALDDYLAIHAQLLQRLRMNNANRHPGLRRKDLLDKQP